MKRFAFLFALLAIAMLIWFLGAHKKVATVVPNRPGFTATSAPTASDSPAAQTPALDSASAAALLLNSPSTTIAADLHIVSEVIDSFRTNFPRDGNPVGDNVEITAALTGKNKLRLVLIPPEHPAINSRGELCDRWGSPFFFHQLSGTQMEIRSAGPDKTFWTSDDITLTP